MSVVRRRFAMFRCRVECLLSRLVRLQIVSVVLEMMYHLFAVATLSLRLPHRCAPAFHRFVVNRFGTLGFGAVLSGQCCRRRCRG